MIVLDASAGCGLTLDHPKAEALRDLMLEGEKIAAPELYLSEVIHVMQKLVRGNRISDKEAGEYARKAVSLVDEFVPMSGLYQEALSESIRLNHSSYDLFYFVLARRNAATLFTMDRRLIDLALRNGLNCVFEAEVAPGESWTIRAETEDAAKL